jgi:hypothetical protein
LLLFLSFSRPGKRGFICCFWYGWPINYLSNEIEPRHSNGVEVTI